MSVGSTVGEYLSAPYSTHILPHVTTEDKHKINFENTVCHVCKKEMSIVSPSGFKTDNNVIIASYKDDCTLFLVHNCCITILPKKNFKLY